MSALLAVTPARALEVLIQGDRLSLKARNEKLSTVLQRFAHAGVDVRIDPSIEATVNGNIEDEEMQTALDKLLQHYSYVLVWDVVEGPVGTLPRLAEIRIFKPERKRDVRPLPGTDENLRVTTGPNPNGPLFVQDEVLLAVKPGTKLEDFKRLLKQVGGSVVSSIPHLGIYRVRLPPGTNVLALIQQLEQKNMVAGVEPNYVTRVPLPERAESAGEDEGGDTVRRLARGAPPVAILDSGLTHVQGLDAFVVGRLDALSPTRSLSDKAGHGTQMALIASGAVHPDGASSAGRGDAVPIVAVRAFDDNGYASNFGLMRSIDFALVKGSRVINMSWGTETDSRFLANAVAYAQSKGALVVASAGNEPLGKPVYPAAYPGVISVTALEGDGSLWSKSNYGDFTYVAAPAKARFPIGHKGPPGAYAGTSIASAYVARALSLYLAGNPNASRTQALTALREAVTDAGPKGKDPYYGYGALDAKALNRLLR